MLEYVQDAAYTTHPIHRFFMPIPVEAAYRHTLAGGPDCLVATLNTVVPLDATNDTAVTQLTRALCFESAQIADKTAPPLAEALPHMLDHGLRQVALADAVLSDETIVRKLPDWFDSKLFGRALLVADAGLVFVPPDEVKKVNAYGPKHMQQYTKHPHYGYEMAQQIADPHDADSKKLSLLIARHHAIQARRAYGPTWAELDSKGVDAHTIDLMIAMQKPFDYFDDTFSRPMPACNDFAEQARVPLRKFQKTFGELLDTHPDLQAYMDRIGFDPQLPHIIADKILTTILDDDPDGVSEAYRQLRPDLQRPQTVATYM